VWHVSNAVLIIWRELRHLVKRDFIDSEGFERLMSESESPWGAPWSLYGSFNKWFAIYAFWLFQAYGHEDVRVMDGGGRPGLRRRDQQAGRGPASPRRSIR
jgi:thiosulfate/3-mercaptopyruvate sulfurtransferase